MTGVAPIVGAPVVPSATPTPAAVVPTGSAPAGASATDWMSGLSDDMKGYMGNKGFKGPADLADSYRNLEKLQGVPQDRLLKVPERFLDDAGKLTPEGRAVYERLGAPKEAKDYNLAVPKEGGDPKLMEHFKNVFLESGVPKAAAEKIVASWNEYQATQGAAAKEAAVAAFKSQEATLKTEWGAAHDQNINIAKEAVRTMGMSAQQIDALSGALGHAETMKLFNKLGKSVGEAPFISGRPANNILEPASAQTKIRELRSDRDFGAKLMRGDAEAKATWESLHKQAFPGEHRIS